MSRRLKQLAYEDDAVPVEVGHAVRFPVLLDILERRKDHKVGWIQWIRVESRGYSFRFWICKSQSSHVGCGMLWHWSSQAGASLLEATVDSLIWRLCKLQKFVMSLTKLYVGPVFIMCLPSYVVRLVMLRFHSSLIARCGIIWLPGPTRMDIIGQQCGRQVDSR